jgi:hypothetical protein
MNAEDDLEEFLAMKFNMTKAESALFIKRILALTTGKFTKEQMIAKFILYMGKDI